MSAPTCSTPNELPDLRLWLRDQWRPGGPFSRVAEYSPLGLSEPGLPPYDPSKFSHYEHRTLSEASLWWVAPDMVDLLLASAPTIPDDARGDELQVPAPAGLIVFGKPWFGLDAWGTGNAVQVDALTWNTARLPYRPGEEPRLAWALSTYTRVVLATLPKERAIRVEATAAGAHPGYEFDQDSPRVPGVPEHLDGDTVVLPSGLMHDMQGGGPSAIRDWGAVPVAITSSEGPAVGVEGIVWTPLGRSDWVKSTTIVDNVGVMDDGQHASAVEDRRVFGAFCALIAQEGIAHTETRPAQRQAAKRTERAGLPREASKLRIITLRQVHRTESAPTEDGHGVAYSHRWIVNGHWRWQPYGPGRSLRRLQYIRPFVKGPEGAELKIKQEVRAWVR